jgi:hypothetical protein
MSFKENLNTAVFTTRFVIEDNSPLLFVFHYDDNTWQFSGGETNLTDDDFRVVSLGEMIEYDKSILELENMPINSEAMRLDEKSSWRITVKN